MIAKNKTSTDKSSATPPIRMGGINLRKALIGGSVTTNRGSAITANHRGGRKFLEND